MKIIREHIYEKFTEDGDPIHDMGIGINVPRNFNSRDEMNDWLSEYLPIILKLKKFPEDILSVSSVSKESKYYINVKYSNKLVIYVSKYLSINNESALLYPENFHIFLKRKYPHLKSWMIKESLNEKFTEENSDPIVDLGIGIQAKLNTISIKQVSDPSLQSQKIVKKICELMKLPQEKIYYLNYLFDERSNNSKKISEIEDIINKFKKIDELSLEQSDVGVDLILYKSTNKYILKEGRFTIHNYWGNINAALYIGVDKILNEKFTEDSDPIHDMNIGMGHLMNKWFKEIGMNPDRPIDELLSICARNGKLDFVEYLVERGANAKSYGSDALQQAAANNRIDTVKFLLSTDADVKGNNSFGLRWAARCGYYEMVKLLLDAGADIHAGEDYALRMAKSYKNSDIVDLLKQYGADDKIVKESLNEKFTEDTDPIYDMGIGYPALVKKWKEEVEIEGRKPSDDSSRKYFESSNYPGEGFLVWKILKDITELDHITSGNIQDVFQRACDRYYDKDEKIWTVDLNKVAYALKKFYNIDVDPNIEPNLNEKFTEEGDPIEDLGIGVETYLINKLGLEKGKELPEVFRSKKYWDNEWMIEEPFCNTYGFKYGALNFYGFDHVKGKHCIIASWGDYNYYDRKAWVAYPIDQFLKDE